MMLAKEVVVEAKVVVLEAVAAALVVSIEAIVAVSIDVVVLILMADEETPDALFVGLVELFVVFVVIVVDLMTDEETIDAMSVRLVELFVALVVVVLDLVTDEETTYATLGPAAELLAAIDVLDAGGLLEDAPVGEMLVDAEPANRHVDSKFGPPQTCVEFPSQVIAQAVDATLPRLNALPQ